MTVNHWKQNLAIFLTLGFQNLYFRLADHSTLEIIHSTESPREWPNTAIIGLTTLLSIVVLAPIGWIVHKHWLKDRKSHL